MTALQGDGWPPEPITTERLVVRTPRESDRDAFVGLLSSSHGPGRLRHIVLAPVANTASSDLLQRLGFHEREHFTEFDALQSLWSRELAA